uniref:Uncharacterized protein n=1 Tax=Cacopsylla melanoneura TaxID=428564 RepID=A0A8D8UEU7_9HEMI
MIPPPPPQKKNIFIYIQASRHKLRNGTLYGQIIMVTFVLGLIYIKILMKFVFLIILFSLFFILFLLNVIPYSVFVYRVSSYNIIGGWHYYYVLFCQLPVL